MEVKESSVHRTLKANQEAKNRSHLNIASLSYSCFTNRTRNHRSGSHTHTDYTK